MDFKIYELYLNKVVVIKNKEQCTITRLAAGLEVKGRQCTGADSRYQVWKRRDRSDRAQF